MEVSIRLHVGLTGRESGRSLPPSEAKATACDSVVSECPSTGAAHFLSALLRLLGYHTMLINSFLIPTNCC